MSSLDATINMLAPCYLPLYAHVYVFQGGLATSITILQILPRSYTLECGLEVHVCG